MSEGGKTTGRMVVLGSDRLIIPLAAVGFEPVRCGSGPELHKALMKLSGRVDVVLVVCGESAAAVTPEAIEEFREKSDAILMVLPDTSEARRLDAEALRVAVEQAAGVDLLGKELKK